MAMRLTRTICCKLAVDGQDTTILAATARAFNAAASWVAQVCWDEGLTNPTIGCMVRPARGLAWGHNWPSVLA
jgi:hypothetical protein